MQKDIAAMYQIEADRSLIAQHIGVLERDQLRQLGLLAARLGDLEHIS
jgi:hypothetical protein